MKYDDASWHYGGDFPADLPPEAGATHTGMFLAWAVLNGLAGETLEEDAEEELVELRKRAVTPGAFFLNACDGKLIDEDLSEEGNEFTLAHYDCERSAYMKDYGEILTRDLPTTYHVADSWDNYDLLAPRLDERFSAWRRRRK